jgi:hypothetical protein
MSRMAERAALIEDVENIVGDYRAGNPDDLRAILQALRELKTDDYVKGMPEVKRCPIIGELMGNPYAWVMRPVCESCQEDDGTIDYYTIDGRTDGGGNAIGVPLCQDCIDNIRADMGEKF